MNQQTIDRLRASQKTSDKQEREAGLKAGREWAMSTAEATQLRRLAKVVDEISDSDWNRYLFDRETSAYSAAEDIYFEIEPERKCERRTAVSFWESITGNEEPPEAEFVDGFVEGATTLWAEVQDKLG